MTERFEVAYTSARPPIDVNYLRVSPSVRTEGNMIIEQDVTVTLRDGTRIYVDLYRPVGAERVPTLIAWSPYGKRAGFYRCEIYPNNAGVPVGAVSSYAKFEGPDPRYWCGRGYAIVNPDPRGAWKSEGDQHFFGDQDARDTYDVIEWVATQPWSNEKVGMTGNSYLSASQWMVGPLRPPHLAALAPWEGMSDIYRDLAMRGGIPENKFTPDFMNHVYGEGRREDILAMQETHPFFDEYWQTKAPDVSKINVPIYVVGSWTNMLHARGTLEAFKALTVKDKWLRIHDNFEWPDYYEEQNVEDLRRFFDRYLKDIENGWEETPPVRLNLLDKFKTSAGPFVEQQWPLTRARYQPLYLDAATRTMAVGAFPKEASASYQVENADACLNFDFEVEQPTAIVGHMKLRLWVEADGCDDMDLFVLVTKIAADGTEVFYDVAITVSPGALGWLRVSHRRLDPDRSRPEQPYLKHEDEQRLSPGEIVPVDIEIWPWGGIWHAGEKLRVKVSPRPLCTFTHHGLGRNAGRHIIYTGGNYDSHLLVPFVDGMV